MIVPQNLECMLKRTVMYTIQAAAAVLVCGHGSQA